MFILHDICTCKWQISWKVKRYFNVFVAREKNNSNKWQEVFFFHSYFLYENTSLPRMTDIRAVIHIYIIWERVESCLAYCLRIFISVIKSYELKQIESDRLLWLALHHLSPPLKEVTVRNQGRTWRKMLNQKP